MVRPCGFPGTAFFISLPHGRGLGCEGGADLGGLSFYRLGTGDRELMGMASLQRWVLGCMGFTPGLFSGEASSPAFSCT